MDYKKALETDVMENWKVYLYTFPNEKKYVGVTKRTTKERFQNGNGYRNNLRMTRAIKKYGKENIKIETIKENLTKEEAEKLEIKLIKDLKTQEKNNGYNICNGGLINIPSEETKIKISLANKGNKKWLGKKHSEETKLKMKDKFVTEETKLKMSITRKKRITKEETKTKMSLARKNKKFSEEHKAKLKLKNIETTNKMKMIILYSKDGIEKEFLGIKELAREINVASASIIRCCKNKQKTAGGYTFKYKEEK